MVRIADNGVITINRGDTFSTPLFINEGEKIIVSTKDGKYVSRA